MLLAAAAPAARADADPASDVLLTQGVYLPFFGEQPSRHAADELKRTVDQANAGGYQIKVAVLGTKNDLGGVGGLWGQPQRYADFLGQELTLVYHERLLVLMPAGFGFYWQGHNVSREQAAVRRVKIEAGIDGLVLSAGQGVAAAARTAGINVTPPSTSSGGGGGPPRALIAAGGAVLLILVVGGPFAVRAWRRRATAGA